MQEPEFKPQAAGRHPCFQQLILLPLAVDYLQAEPTYISGTYCLARVHQLFHKHVCFYFSESVPRSLTFTGAQRFLSR